MNDNYVGASVLNVITESLYDNPIQVQDLLKNNTEVNFYDNARAYN